MITSIARQAVILKCLQQKSLLVGNYEFYYIGGLMKQLFHLELTEEMNPLELSETILQALPSIHTDNEQEAFLLRMVSIYEPGESYDDQMKELFRWGEKEPDLWQVVTSHSGEEFAGKAGA